MTTAEAQTAKDDMADARADRPTRQAWWLFAIGVGLVVLLALIAIAISGGRFEYSLDDAYIHLRLSDQIWQGNYGINAGEISSPSSSIGWPLILAMFAWSGIHEYVPLLLNALAVGLTLVVAHKGLSTKWIDFDANGRRAAGTVVAAGLCLNWFGIAITGMEQSAQILCVAAAAAGISRLAYTGRSDWWLWLALLVGPILRYESLSVTFAVGVIAILLGRWRNVLAVWAGVAVALLGFSAFLRSNDLALLPSSVLAKGVGGGGVKGALTESFRSVFGENAYAHNAPATWILLTICAAALLVAVRIDRRMPFKSRPVLLLSTAVVVLGGQTLLGDVQYWARYDVYALTYALLILGVVGAFAIRRLFDSAGTVLGVIVIGVLIFGLVPTHFKTTVITPLASRNIADQQREIARFTAEFLQAPIAVNDIGEVAYRGGFPIVDLAGLASAEARELRQSGVPGWMSQVVDPEAVPAAVIYPEWFPRQVPDTWVKVGTISNSYRASAAFTTATVYATSAANEAEVRAALDSFGDSTGPRTRVEMARQEAPSR